MNPRIDLAARAGELVRLLCVLHVLWVCSDSVSPWLLCRPAAMGRCRSLACGARRLGRILSEFTQQPDERPFRAVSVEKKSSSDDFVLDTYVILRVSGCTVVHLSLAANAATHTRYHVKVCAHRLAPPDVPEQRLPHMTHTPRHLVRTRIGKDPAPILCHSPSTFCKSSVAFSASINLQNPRLRTPRVSYEGRRVGPNGLRVKRGDKRRS